jgi:hypothetical protein
MYGWKFAPTAISFDFPFLYVKCLLYISSAGPGPNERRQRDYVAGMVHATSAGAVDTDLMAYIENFDRALHRVPALADTQSGQLLQQNKPQVARLQPLRARLILYDALKVATVMDGCISRAEAKDTSDVARDLGVADTTLHKLATVVDKEHRNHKRKQMLLFPSEDTGACSHTPARPAGGGPRFASH